jgi:molybdopterin-guanine dinucleotide biosynthesis protein A
VPDDERFRGDGPLAGILAALQAVDVPEGERPPVAVLAVDLVDASPALFRWLRYEWRDGDVALVPTDATGRPQPLHAVVGADLAPHLERALAAGERRVLRVLETAGARTLTPPAELADAALGWSSNRNTPPSEPE